VVQKERRQFLSQLRQNDRFLDDRTATL